MFEISGTRALARALLVGALTLTLTTLAVNPAQAQTFFNNHAGTYESNFSYISPTMIENATPPAVEWTKETDLNTGRSGANICNTPSGSPFYNAISSPLYSTVFLQFGSGSLVTNSYTAGDTFQESAQGDVIWDNDRDGNPGPAQVLRAQFDSVITGRSMTMTFSYNLSYNDNGCQNEVWQIAGTISS